MVSIFCKVCLRSESAQAEIEMAKPVHSGFQQCIRQSMSKCRFQALRSYCDRAQRLSGMYIFEN